MKKLRRLAAKESESEQRGESQSTIQAVQPVTFVLTIPVNDARLARSVAVRWLEEMQTTGTTPSAEGVTAQQPAAGHTIRYNFVMSRPATFKYRGLVDIDRRGSMAGPSAGHRERTTATGHDGVPPSDLEQPTDGGRAGTTVRRAVGRARRFRGRLSIEAQLMANCHFIRHDPAEYDGGPPVQRFLRWSGATLAAAVQWVSGICGGPRDPDTRC